jgi:uncharacterized protein (TIGR00106 family)
MLPPLRAAFILSIQFVWHLTKQNTNTKVAVVFIRPAWKGRGFMAGINLSLQVIPNAPPERVYPIVDKVIEMIAQSGVRYEVGPMETTMEGELDTLLEIVKKAQQICVQEGAARVLSVIKIDYRPEGVTIDEKVGKYRKKE